MSSLITRTKDLEAIKKMIALFPATAILGARQCGKSTLARQMHADHYFDLENPRDLTQLQNPQLALENLTGLIVIDEIQRKPDLFPLLRYLIDAKPERKFLILGSASRDLIKQSSDSLAGRIGYYYLGGLRLGDVGAGQLDRFWLRGAFPRSFTAETDAASGIWLDQYITTFLERDIPQLGITIPAAVLRRFWIMLSHYHGQIINYSEMATSFGVSDHTIRRYLDILAGTFMVRLLQPWHVNLGKRLVKRPKIYLRDSGIFHRLQTIDSPASLLSHPKLGASWEGLALEVVAAALDKNPEELFFWRTHSGVEVDLFWQHQGKNWAVECKYTDTPKLTASMRHACQSLQLEHLWMVYPGQETYRLADNITALPLPQITTLWPYETTATSAT